MDVFWCSAPQSNERVEIALETLDYWKAQPVKLHILTPKVIGCADYDFQRLRRIEADKRVLKGLYILADDDCLPTSEWQIAEEAIRSNPDFAIVSAWPTNATIQRWTPEGYEPRWNLQLEEHCDVGGLRMCRANTMFKGWPLQVRSGYDREHCEALRDCGWRVGYSQFWRAIHMGEGCSDVWELAQSL